MQEASRQQTDTVNIVYYTDPLCCWSWAFEPQWRKFRYLFQDIIRYRYCMGGLLAGWEQYHDPMNSISRPFQMGPVWTEAQHISGMPMDDKVWLHNPPASSYQACIAVKCAGLQSAQAEEAMLRVLREAVMLKGQNIAEEAVLLKAARTLAEQAPALLDYNRFSEDLAHGRGQQLFQEDLQQVRYHGIARFPTLTLQREGKKGVIITGYRPFDVLVAAFKQVYPELEYKEDALERQTYAAAWASITERELQEVQSQASS